MAPPTEAFRFAGPGGAAGCQLPSLRTRTLEWRTADPDLDHYRPRPRSTVTGPVTVDGSLTPLAGETITSKARLLPPSRTPSNHRCRYAMSIDDMTLNAATIPMQTC